ncbi:hypothetical protein PFISCL1PPCAC_9477 [Pristionchus fissidentatus]|uniref:SXP/RAL-2 family protein Ani s 5-like cation-binding domain-containing protein n=1 Tax=Pristionchus fissidentatus TaxID=1538716 RepID=A0AAV5VJR9_9BILA|nr:hypothetical protein PFISCL1PPCAC_9477 [Pristionchus fissidentatus]
MLLLCAVALLSLADADVVTIPKAENSSEFIDRFNVIAAGIIDAVGVVNNCSASIFEKFVKSDKDATWTNLVGCVNEKVNFENSFKTPLQNYQTQFTKLVEAEQAAMNTRVNATRTSLEEKAAKIGRKLEQFGKNMLNKLHSFGVTLKESDFVQGMKKAVDDMKERVSHVFDKIINFFG